MTEGFGQHSYVDRKYFGKYRAIVHNNLDEQKLGRVKVIVPDLLGEEIVTNWAYPVFPIDFFGVPEIGTAVYVEFESGDIERPIYTGCWFGKFDAEEVYTYHSHIIGEADENIDSYKETDTITTPDGDEIEEPEGKFEGNDDTYPKIRSYKMKSGLIVEIDESNEDGPRVQLFHPSGKFVEMHPDGSIVSKNKGEYKSTEGDEGKHVTGKSSVEIEGDVSLFVGGRELKRVSGNSEYEVKGNLTITVDGPITIEGDRIEFKGGSGPSAGVITGASVCPYTGSPHSDASKTVGATK